MDKLQRLTLVLNASYEAVNVISAKRAITLVMGAKAVVESPSEQYIRSGKLSIQVPSVVRLLVYRRVPRHNRAVSRKSILLRDQYLCQYCRVAGTPKSLTLDHVIPKSRGGGSTWENLTTCCFSCNNIKGDRTPEEAGMRLLRKPSHIGIHSKHRLLMPESDRKEWEPYLFG